MATSDSLPRARCNGYSFRHLRCQVVVAGMGTRLTARCDGPAVVFVSYPGSNYCPHPTQMAAQHSAISPDITPSLPGWPVSQVGTLRPRFSPDRPCREGHP
jgi:hypothetical protein